MALAAAIGLYAVNMALHPWHVLVSDDRIRGLAGRRRGPPVGPDLVRPGHPYDAGPVHPEYHWAGLQLLAGNLYLLAGLVLLAAGIS